MKFIILNTANNLFVSRISDTGVSYVGHYQKPDALIFEKRIDAERFIAKHKLSGVRVVRVVDTDVLPIIDQFRVAIKNGRRWDAFRLFRQHRSVYYELTDDERLKADLLVDLARESL